MAKKTKKKTSKGTRQERLKFFVENQYPLARLRKRYLAISGFKSKISSIIVALKKKWNQMRPSDDLSLLTFDIRYKVSSRKKDSRIISSLFEQRVNKNVSENTGYPTIQYAIKSKKEKFLIWPETSKILRIRWPDSWKCCPRSLRL